MTLKELFIKYGHTDKHTKHTYDEHYEKWFSPLKDKEINILEIGVSSYGGGALLAFAEYFTKGTVYGLDNEINIILPEVMKHEKIKIIEGDAYDSKITKKLPDIKFDIIIDDCVHNHKSQMIILNSFYPLLKENGIFVIEDVKVPELHLYKDEVVSGMKLKMEMINLIHLRPKRTNNVLVRYHRS